MNVLITNMYNELDSIITSKKFEITYIQYAGEQLSQREHLDRMV